MRRNGLNLIIMRKSILSILLLILSLVVSGQTTFNRLEDYYDSNGTAANFFRAVCSFNGSYYGAVRIYNQGTQYLGVVKLNSSGSLIKKSLKYSPKGNIVVYPNQTIISTSDSNLMICSNLVDTAWDGYLIKLNTNLDTLWTKEYDLPANMAGCASGSNTINYFTAIKETPDKGFIIAGNYYKYCINNMSNQRGFLLKVDSVGNITWWKVYQNVMHLYDIELTSDGGYVFLNKYSFTKFTKTDSLGNIQWSSIPSIYVGQSEAGDITPCGNNEYVVALPYEYQSLKYGINAYKINVNTQQIIWDTTYFLYHTVQCLSLNQNMGVEVDNNGNIIIWATAHINPAPYVGGKRGAILKLNSQGDSLWAKYYDAPNITWDDDLQLNDLIISPDGGFFGVGYEQFNNGSIKAWLFKTDANGVVGFENTKEKVKSIKFSVYPNPAKSSTTLEFDKALIHPLDIKVYNTLGQMLLHTTIEKGASRTKLDLSGFEAGLYYYELQNQAQTMGSGKFVVE